MTKAWKIRKNSLTRETESICQRAAVLDLLMIHDEQDQWRAIVAMHAETLVLLPDGTVHRSGPIMLGLLFHSRLLTQAPHPMELVTVLQPWNVHNPHVARTGSMCLGHPPVGVGIELVLHQAWACLQLNQLVNTEVGNYLNAQAAAYVRNHPDQFPLSRLGLFEAAPLAPHNH